jgi:RimJ/RimL family protein N-acetyltransferase
MSRLIVRPATTAGAALLRFADAWARDRGMRHIGLTAFATNERALAVYRRLGYRPTLVTLTKPVVNPV